MESFDADLAVVAPLLAAAFATGLATALDAVTGLAAGLAADFAADAAFLAAGLAAGLAIALAVVFFGEVLMVLLSDVALCVLDFELPSNPPRKPRFLPLSVALAIENLLVPENLVG